MKVHVSFVELGQKLRTICAHEYDLTSGSGLPVEGDIVWLFDKDRRRQFWVVERHWNIGNIIGNIMIYVTSTSEQAKTI